MTTTPESTPSSLPMAHTAFGTFAGIDTRTWNDVWQALIAADGNSVAYVSMEIGADLDLFHPVKEMLWARGITAADDPLENGFIQRHLHGPEKIPNYSGGLGILAGDILKSMAACRIPATGISLLYKKGYFSQIVDSRLGQIAHPTEWKPEDTPNLYRLAHPFSPDRPLIIEVPFADESRRQALGYAQIWLKLELNETLDFFVPVFLLDYNVPASPLWIREAANHLYDSSSDRVKALQRRLLGSGLVTLMDILGLSARTIHLNEQHGAVAIVLRVAEHLYNRFGPEAEQKASTQDIVDAAAIVAGHFCYTIHTPVKAGHDRFPKTLYHAASNNLCQKVLDVLAQDPGKPSEYNFTRLAMQVNRRINSVSRLHRDVTRLQFPEHKERIVAITNGVHHLTWISDNRKRFLDAVPAFDGWRQNPGVFAKTTAFLTDAAFRQDFESAWQKDTEVLVRYVNAMLIEHRHRMQESWIDPPNFFSMLEKKERELAPEIFSIGFARRFSTYKRADLIFHDVERLAAIIRDNNWPVQFFFAGKAHPQDEPGKHVLKSILEKQEQLFVQSKGLAKLIFIPDYDMKIARMMVSGVHVWLNTPKRPLEASGTSGMKAALNGVPNCSILDGWWIEGFHGGKTGWKFGFDDPMDDKCLSEDADALLYEQDAASFYETLPEILRTFYRPELRDAYLDRGLMNLALNAPIFNTHRVVAEYTDLYGLDLDDKRTSTINGLKKLYRSEDAG